MRSSSSIKKIVLGRVSKPYLIPFPIPSLPFCFLFKAVMWRLDHYPDECIAILIILTNATTIYANCHF
jgi:hypothetical protein